MKDQINHSRPVKFETGTLVKWIRHSDKRTFIVDHNSGEDSCWIHHRDFNQPIPVSEIDVRAQTWWEFASFMHPMSGLWMVGKTRGYMAAIIHLFAGILIAVSLATWGDGPTWTATVIGVWLLVGFWIGTWLNYTGRWK